MTLSRTSRILLGFLLLAFAVFIWMNLYLGGGAGFSPLLQAAPSPDAGAVDPIPVAAQPADGETRVARDLEIVDLPFLITEPPAADEPTADENEAADLLASQQNRPPRATVNPFAPILQPSGGSSQAAAQPQAQPAGEPTPAPQVTEVFVPPAPSTPVPRASTIESAPRPPAPAPVAPRADAPAALPRALPDGSLAGAPELLRRSIGPSAPPIEEVREAVTVTEPEEVAPEQIAAPEEETDLQVQAAPDEALQAEEPQEESPPQPLALRPVSRPPLEAGNSQLSRYLRDNDVRFTGSVIGPVSVGVFRASFTSAPIVISLGQTLPDTSIVLTDLRGQQAEFTLEDDEQILTLELRR